MSAFALVVVAGFAVLWIAAGTAAIAVVVAATALRRRGNPGGGES